MAAISLHLPDDLALESKQVAERIGVSRTELIRQALRHDRSCGAASGLVNSVE